MCREDKIRREAIISITAEPENIDPADSFEREEDIAWANQQVESGNVWGWCHVVVTATWRCVVGSDGLGGCSYEDEEAFKVPGGYFDDMKRAALDDLCAKVAAICAE